MALFKKVNYIVKDVKVPFSINIDGNGIFWCKPNDVMCKALGIDQIIGNTYNEVNQKLWDAVKHYNELNTEHSYFLRYRLHISPAVKNRMPKELMDSDMRKKTSNSAGTNEFYRNEIALTVEWHGLVKTTLGQTVVKKKMRLATENDYDLLARYGDLYKKDFHLVFPEHTFYAYDMEHDFYPVNWFEIPLTIESYYFFCSIEQSFITMITKLLSFVGREPKMLMLTINDMASRGLGWGNTVDKQ